MSNKITIDEITIDGKLYDIKPPYKVDVKKDYRCYFAQGELNTLNYSSNQTRLENLIKNDLNQIYKSYVLCDIKTLTKDAVKLRHNLIERFGFWVEGYGYLHKAGA